MHKPSGETDEMPPAPDFLQDLTHPVIPGIPVPAGTVRKSAPPQRKKQSLRTKTFQARVKAATIAAWATQEMSPSDREGFETLQALFPEEQSLPAWNFLTQGEITQNETDTEKLSEEILKAVDHRFSAFNAPELFEAFVEILEKQIKNIRVAILLCLDDELLQETIDSLAPPKSIPEFSHIVPPKHIRPKQEEGDTREDFIHRINQAEGIASETFLRTFREPFRPMTKIILGQPHIPSLTNKFQNTLLQALQKFVDEPHLIIQKTDPGSETSDTEI